MYLRIGVVGGVKVSCFLRHQGVQTDIELLLGKAC